MSDKKRLELLATRIFVLELATACLLVETRREPEAMRLMDLVLRATAHGQVRGHGLALDKTTDFLLLVDLVKEMQNRDYRA